MIILTFQMLPFDNEKKTVPHLSLQAPFHSLSLPHGLRIRISWRFFFWTNICVIQSCEYENNDAILISVNFHNNCLVLFKFQNGVILFTL